MVVYKRVSQPRTRSRWTKPYSRRIARRIARQRIPVRRGGYRTIDPIDIDPIPNIRTGGFLGIEKKFIDTVKTSTNLVAAWAGSEVDPAANALCCPTKGTGPSNRNGDHIVIKSIQVRGIIRSQAYTDQADPPGPASFTVLLVLDKQTNGAQLSGEEVMVDTAPKEFSFRNLQYSRRFTILKSLRGSLHQIVSMADGANTGSFQSNERHFNWFVRCNIPVNFKGDAGTVADIVDNSLHIIACSTDANALTIKYHARCRFVG